MFTKPLIFVVISLLVALVYSSISGFNVFAAPKEVHSSAECKEYTTSNAVYGFITVTDCCWTETDPDDPEGIELYYCQSCTQNGCNEKRPASQGPTPPPSGPVAPQQGGVLEQLQNDQPPLFGRDVPLQGFGVFGQQPAAIVPPSPVPTPVPPVLTPEPPVPMFGSAQDATPTPPPQFGQIAPQGQASPSLGEETQEQATEEQATEEDEQVIAKDDDDDGPVPPECPTTGPIPPDCTMKPKFPEERAIE